MCFCHVQLAFFKLFDHGVAFWVLITIFSMIINTFFNTCFLLLLVSCYFFIYFKTLKIFNSQVASQRLFLNEFIFVS